jgi:predicted GNAT family N-acyltransferase
MDGFIWRTYEVFPVFKLEVKSQITGTERRRIEQLIFDVWSHEQEAQKDVEIITSRDHLIPDALNEGAHHVMVFLKNELIGYGRITLFLSPDDLKRAPKEVPVLDSVYKSAAFISRLVVHPKARRQGVATMISEKRLAIAHSYDVDIILACAVGEYRQKSLQSAGFKAVADVPKFITPWYTTSRPVKVMKLDLHPQTLQKTLSL